MKSYKREYSVDELYDLYINKNLSAQEIANIYNVPRYIIEGDLKKNNIHKPKQLSYELRMKKIDKQSLYDFYIIQDHNMADTAIYFNVGEGTISRYCHLYNIKKEKNHYDIKKKKQINKDELYKYYIIENHSNDETAAHFNVHARTLRRRLREYGIYKSVDSQVKCSQKHQIEKYGDLFTRSEYYKRNVVSNMIEKGKQTCLQKYGAPNWLMTEEGVKRRKARYFYNDIKFDSSWELAVYIYAIDHNEDIIREPVVLEYYIEDKIHYYIPDFLYNNKLIEIKGNHLIKNGKLQNVYKKSSYKDEAKQKCLEENNVIIWQDQDIKFALEYVKNKYGYKYLRQFKIIE